MFPCRNLALLGLLYAAPLVAEYPTYGGTHYALGRIVWLENCETCHAYGVAGAPLASSSESWVPRVAKGRETLYKHALDGFFGPGATMMPPRGGNESLTDEEVKAAVDYMVRYATDTDLTDR